MRLLKIFLLLIPLQGFIAMMWFLQTRSEAENALFLGLSAYRLVLLAVQLGLFLFFAFIGVYVWRSPARGEAILRRLDSRCIDQKWLGAILLAVGVVLFTLPLAALFYRAVQSSDVPILPLALNRLLPLFAWFYAILITIGLSLIIRYWQAIKLPEMWRWERMKAAPIAVLILTATLVHWLILFFRVPILVDIPAWYWHISAHPLTIRDGVFLAAALILFGLICWLLFARRQVKAGLLLVFITGCLLQFGIGFLSGNGLSTLHARYFTKYHRTYVVKASQDNLPIFQMVQDYENVYGNRRFTSTKPPGLMAFFVGMDRLVNGYPSSFSSQERFDRLSWAIVYVFPFLAMLLVFVLFFFARKFVPGGSGAVGSIAPVLLITCPSVVLFSLYMDQAVYPILFVLGAWAIIETIQRQTLAGALLLGSLLYAMIFFAFTMLPLYPLAGIFLLIHYLVNREKFPFRRQVQIGLMMAAGTILLFLVFRLVFNYDFFHRFTTTVDINHQFDFYERVDLPPPDAPEALPVRVQQILRAAWTNNLEFATAVGFPLYILFLAQAVSLAVRTFRRSPLPGDNILGAFLLSFLVLNLAGTAQGEVARLWIFWIPMVLLFAAYEIEKWVEKRPAVLWGIVFVQLVTVLLTYHFQDLVM